VSRRESFRRLRCVDSYWVCTESTTACSPGPAAKRVGSRHWRHRVVVVDVHSMFGARVWELVKARIGRDGPTCDMQQANRTAWATFTMSISVCGLDEMGN